MKNRQKFALLFAAAALAALAGAVVAQEGPKRDPGETVAKPRKPGAPPEPNQAPIPSKLSKKANPDIPAGLPSFKSDVSVVSVDVAVLTTRATSFPRSPAATSACWKTMCPSRSRVISMGEAPMTLAMVIEFSNLFQYYWGETWYQTLTASYGFLETLKPEDFVAVVAYDMRPEILSDFSADKRKAMEAMQRLRIPAFSRQLALLLPPLRLCVRVLSATRLGNHPPDAR